MPHDVGIMARKLEIGVHFKLKECSILGLQYKLLSVGNNIFAKDSQIKHQMYPFLCTNFSHISYLPFYVALERTSSNNKNFLILYLLI